MKNQKKVGRRVLFSSLCIGCLAWMLFSITGKATVQEEEKEEKAASFHIVLDAGHGGSQYGAVTEIDGEEVFEKDLDLRIAKYLQEELLKYEGVKVTMTRESDVTVGLRERSEIARQIEADLFVSLHNNAKGEIAMYENGCTVLTPKGQYEPEMAEIGQTLGVNILYELSKLGLEDQGLLLRTSETGSTYPNGELADYYGLIHYGVLNKIPSIIVEHAFMDHLDDYKKYLSDEEKLRKLAQADARGIARCYQLKEKETGKVLEELENIKTRLVWVKDGNAEHNEISEKIFYEREEDVTKKQTTTERSTEKEIILPKEKEESVFEKIISTIKKVLS